MIKTKKLVVAAMVMLVVATPLFSLAPMFLGKAAAASPATWENSGLTKLKYSGDTYTRNNTSDDFYGPTQSNCKPLIRFSSSDLSTATSATYSAGFYEIQQKSCNYINFSSISVTPPKSATAGAGDTSNGTTSATAGTAAGGDTTGSGDSSSADSTDGIDPCETKLSNPLSWFACPVIDMINGGVTFMQNTIDYLMEFDVTPVFDKTTDSGKAYYSAWNSFRLFALALIVLAGLTMVIAQALSLEIFDAYTVKKVVPRLFIAAIGISLSWYLLQFLAEFTNAVGLGVRSIIYYPFKDLGGAGLQSTGAAALADLALSGVGLALGIGGVLSLVATAGLAALIAFLVLIIRQMVLIFLILMAPLAIACYVMPNTQKVYTLWWDSLSKGFMMFPIISAFIATGKVFGVVAAHAGGNGLHSDLNQLISVIAFFIPYFALPFTFRLAGGALATIGGLANDRSRGAFDRLKGYRGKTMADRFQRAQNQSLWDNNSAIGKQANKWASRVTDPVNNFAASGIGQNTPGFRKRGARVLSSIEAQQTEQSMKAYEEMNKLFGSNDKAYRATTGQFGGFDKKTQTALSGAGFGSEAGGWKAPTTIDDFKTMSEILSASDSVTERTAGAAVGAFRGRLATMYQDPEMGKADVQAAGLMGLAAHGFATGEDIAKTANSIMEKPGGSMAFANSVAQQAQVLVARSRPDAKAGYGTTIERTEDGKTMFVSGVQQFDGAGGVVKATRDANDVLTETDALGLRGFDVLRAVGPGDIAGAKGGLLKGVDKSGIGDHLEFILRRGGSDQAKSAQASIKAMSPGEKTKLTKTKAGRDQLRLAAAADLYTPMRDQLLQSSSYYSHSSSDIKTGAAKILDATGHQDLREKYDAQRADASHGAHNEDYHAPDPNETM